MLEAARTELRRRRSRPAVAGVTAPSPPGLPLVGHAGFLVRNRLEHLLKLTVELGDVVRLDLPGLTAHLCAHPDHVERVLVGEHRLFTKKTRGYDKLRQFLGNGLVTSEGSFWMRQRRIAQPAFAKRRIQGFGDTMVRCTEDMFAVWDRAAETGEARDIHADMMHLTLRIASLTLLSSDPSAKADAVGSALDVMLHEANDRINSLVDIPDWLPTPRNRRYHLARKTLDDIVMGMIADRRRGEAKDDLLQMLLEARDEETGEGMNDIQLRDEAMTMFLAGHETTANALTWSLLLLSRYPQTARKLADEAGDLLGDRSATAADLPKLEQARRALSESMRLYPPVWVIGRSPSEDVRFDGYPAPRGSLLFISPYVTQRHPKFWEDPEGFDPDRFAPEKQKAMHRFQYFPFSAGPRMCIGTGFAMMEGQLLLATMMRRYRFDVQPGHPIEPEPLITLRPKYGLKVRVHRR
jgi:cytochrome P450